MSGQPKRRQMEQQLEELGGIAWLCEQIGDGHSLRDIAADHFDCSRWSLSRWIQGDPDRVACYDEAKHEGAAAMVEEGKNLLDTADEQSTAGVQKARFRADFRKWYAGVVDRQSFGPPDRRTSVNILSIEHLHLSALQALGGPDAQELLPEASTDVRRLEPGGTFEDGHEEDGQ